MIKLESLSLTLGTHKVFDKLEFEAMQGDRIGLIGSEGSGKTTVLDIIAGRVVPDTGVVKVSGQIVKLNRNIYAQFSELKMAAMTRAEKFKYILKKALDETAGDDRILLLDEPTKNLDSDAVEWLIEFLKKAQPLTVIVASNDRYFLKKVCNKTLTIGDVRVEPIVLPEVELDGDEDVLTVNELKKMVDGEAVFENVSFAIERGQKVALVGRNEVGKTKLLKVLGAGIEVRGEVRFAPDVKKVYMPRVLSSDAAKLELEKLKSSGADFLIMDNPTSCLSLPMIEALERAMVEYKGTMIFADSDHEFIEAVATRIIDLTPDGTIDRISDYNDFLANETVQQQMRTKYKVQ